MVVDVIVIIVKSMFWSPTTAISFQELSPMSLNKALNPARWLLLSLLTIMPATCFKYKMDKGGQSWQVANNTNSQLQYWKLDLFYNKIWHTEKANSISSGLKVNANTVVVSSHQGRQHCQIIPTNKVLGLHDLRGRILQSEQNQAFHFLSCWQHQSSVLNSLMKTCWLGARKPGLH